MTASTRPRGRLPARVYWFRRSLVLGTAMALVFAVAQAVGGTDPGAEEQARTAAAPSAPDPTPTVAPMGPVPAKTGAAAPSGGAAVLPRPDGPCAVDQVTVTPSMKRATAGRSVALTFLLTGISPACTFEISRRTLVAKVVVGPQRIWSTQDCPSSIPTGTVVVRSGTPTVVKVAWSGRTSDGECSRTAPYALPGYYRVIAAAIGSEPSDDKFTLVAPERAVVVRTVQPKPKPKASGDPKATVNAGP